MKKKEKISVITLGCSKNIVDSERLIGQLKLNDIKFVDDPNQADTLIINTCGFIEAAKQESINTILEATELKKSGKVSKVIVSGCLSQRYKDDLQSEIPEVDAYFGTEDYAGILKNLGMDLKRNLLGERELTTPKHFTYLKISEGCDNPCSFCAIPLMRGKHKSKPMKELIAEATSLANKGVKELIIIGQDTTDYGIDIYGKRNISDLLNELSKINGIEWIRLLYAYPSHFPDSLIYEIANNPKVCKYLDIPLQHISDKVLKSMRRGITKRRTIELINKLKSEIPDLILRTTFIVGYPAESHVEFTELCEFIEEVRFDRIGVFNYSVEENTSAFALGDKIDDDEKNTRREKVMEIQKEISLQKNQNMIGKKINVIIDEKEKDYYIARSQKDAPEVDGEVLVYTKRKLQTGHFYSVDIYDCNEYDLMAKI